MKNKIIRCLLLSLTLTMVNACIRTSSPPISMGSMPAM